MKPFFLYILRCADGSYYIGHTDDLETRMAHHVTGACDGYTAERLPVTIEYVEEFATRYDALARERQLKGWSRAKKEAFIQGDWAQVKKLAISRASPRASFDSGPASRVPRSGRTGLET
jgi:predicted GIY-YIG superfamily endonuclease